MKKITKILIGGLAVVLLSFLGFAIDKQYHNSIVGSRTDSGITIWGDIIGDLTEQIDLQAVLDTKLSTTTAASTYQPIGSYISTTTGNWLGTWQSYNPSDFAASTTVSSQWVTSGSNIYSDNAGNVGIGTSIPTSKLHVSGDGLFSGTLTASNLSGTNTGDKTLSELGGVPTSRILTINGTGYDLSSNRSWTLEGLATTTINGINGPAFTFSTGTTGTDFTIATTTGTVTFNIPSSSATNRGLLTSANWSTFNGKQDALTFGIADTNAVKIDFASVADNDFAKFTANGLEGRSYSETLSDIGAQASNANLSSLSGLSYSATAFVKMTGANTFSLDTGTYAAETANTIGALINGSTATTSPSDTDLFAFSASSVLRNITWANLKTSLKTYLDAFYQGIDNTLTALAGLSTGANKIPYFTAEDTADLLDFKDEDTMVSDSATALASQQSIKAYADSKVSTSTVQTLINKRITPRVVATTTATTLAIDSDSVDEYDVTALASDLTFNAPTGSPTNGQKMIFRVKDDGASRALTFATSSNAFAFSSDLAAPTATTISKTMYLGFIWNSAESKWHLLAYSDNY